MEMEFCGWDCWKAARASPRRATRPRIAPRRAYSAASARPSPLDAPVMKTFSGVLIPARRGLHLLRANLRDQIVDGLQHRGPRVLALRAHFVLALHRDGRHAVDLIALDHRLVLLQRALRRERVV